MKTTWYILMILILSVVPISCELLEDETSGDIADKLEGQWSCEDFSSVYNKSALDFYTVYIVIHPLEDNAILIENFHGLGTGNDVEAEISGMTLNISTQTTQDGFTIAGSGDISSNYNKITWSYTVDDGSGEIENVEATYTKIE